MAGSFPSERRLLFVLDLANIARMSWTSHPDRGRTNLQHVEQVIAEIEAVVNRVLPGWSCVFDGIADNSLKKDFVAQNRVPEYEAFLARHGFSTTPNSKLEADPLILDAADRTGAYVVSRDSFWQERYSHHHSWLHRNGRLIQPTLIAGRNVVLVGYRRKAGVPQMMPEILVNHFPTPRNLAAVKNADVKTLEILLASESRQIGIDDLVDEAEREAVDRVVRQVVNTPYVVHNIRPDLSRAEVFEILQTDDCVFHSSGSAILVDEVGAELLRRHSASKTTVNNIDSVLETRDLALLAQLEKLLVAAGPSIELQFVSELSDAMSSEGRINWGPIASFDSRGLDWLLAVLRDKRDTVRLCTFPIRMKGRLTPDAAVDVWVSKYLENKINIERLFAELGPLVDRLAPGQSRLWRMFESVLVEKTIADGVPYGLDIETAGLLCRVLNPGGLLRSLVAVAGGDSLPAVEYHNRGEVESAEILGMIFIRDWLGWPWVTRALVAEIMDKSEHRTVLARGSAKELILLPPVLEYFGSGDTAFGAGSDLRDLVDLSMLHRLASRAAGVLDEVHEALQVM